jgi:glycosyltransferase involved in cell wall biosynthesis
MDDTIGSSAADIAAVVESREWDGPLPTIAVVIPTHNRASFLPELLDALERQSFDRERFEVAIVDDASSDDTWTLLRTACARTPLRLRAARASRNAGPGAARNIAVGLTRAPALAFTDDDCLPTQRWLEALSEALRADIDLVQGRTLPHRDESRAAGPWDRSVWITASTPLYETCNLGWRRDAFERLGGFAVGRPDVPEATRAHFGEDVDLGWRLVQGGGGTAYSADALVYHRVHRSDFRGWLREQRRLSLFPTLIRRTPGMRRALVAGIFLSPRTATFDLALAGAMAAAGSRRPWFLLAAVPWLAARWQEAGRKPGRLRPVRLGQLAIGDAVAFASLVAGSIRARRPVL